MSASTREDTATTVVSSNTLVELYRTSIGKKIVMGLAGLVLAAWIVLHMYGNLHFFEGPEAFNHYSEFLRAMGEPVLGRGQALWAIRVLILAALLAHVVAFVQLWRQSAAAREKGYREFRPEVFSRASKTMKWGGVAILLFVIYHLLHFTWGTAHRDFIHGDPYHNVLVAFQAWPVTAIYLVALAALGLHLYHGVWSVFQTLGLNNPEYNRYRRPFALVVALLISVGFAAVPVAVASGVVP